MCDEMIASVTNVLASHSAELETLEGMLETPPASQQAGISDQLRRMKSSNQQVEQSVDTTVAALMAACEDLLQEPQEHLRAYQAKTHRFDQKLEAAEEEPLLAHIAARLLEMVQELRMENGTLREEVITAKDEIIDLLTRAHAAEQTARVDILTQLPNRRAFEEAHAEFDKALTDSGQLYSLVLIDIDHFKAVNDQYGHASGDAILAMLGRLLGENKRTTDHASRLGGEEFALLLPDCGERSAITVAEHIRRKIERATLRYRNHQLSITVSCGVAEGHAGESRSQLLEKADTALYAAKNRGRNQCSAYADSEGEVADYATSS